MLEKKFLITVDTEGDNLWSWHEGQPITTENANYLPHFQSLCETYGFTPVYLTNLEMAQSAVFQKTIGRSVREGKCEIGMHLHAWNTPPFFELERKYDGLPYITEYPKEIIYEKHQYLKAEIEKHLGVTPVTYRDGRWATNEVLFELLDELGFNADCSVTPEISWVSNPGTSAKTGPNYCSYPKQTYKLTKNMVEIPLTTRKFRCVYGNNPRQIIKHSLLGIDGMLRPATASCELMKRLTTVVEREGNDYLEFMLHSSELMPGGSPYFRTEEAIEKMYGEMDAFFKWIADRGYEGSALKDYAYAFIWRVTAEHSV